MKKSHKYSTIRDFDAEFQAGTDRLGQSEFHTYIKLVGRPPPHRADLSIDAIKTENEVNTIDIFDANNEESFTIETFEDLITACVQQNKDFILARVMTEDESKEGKETSRYFSHYSAHHINKVLFRTQPELGLLHRMRVKNPLNNLTISGDVHYYVVKFEQARNINELKQKTMKINLMNRAKQYLRRMGRVLRGTRSRMMTHELNQTEEPLSSRPIQENLSMAEENKTFFPVLRRLFSMPPESPSESPLSMKSMPSSPFEDVKAGDINLNSKYRRRSIDSASEYKINDEMGQKENKRLALRMIGKDSQLNFDIGEDSHPETKDLESPRKRNSISIDTKLKQETNFDAPKTSVRISIPTSPIDQTSQVAYYKAEFYGTDDDFLIKPEVRKYFKENALNPQDSVLFTLFSHESDVPRINPMHLMQEDPLIRGVSNVISSKLFRLVSLIYFAVAFVVTSLLEGFKLLTAFMFTGIYGVVLFVMLDM